VLAQQAPQPAQYHIQTDQGADRFFRFQTQSGQYRKEVRHEDGSQEGTYGWVDPNGILRMFDYIADHLGYRIVQEHLYNVGPVNPGATLQTRGGAITLGFEVYPLEGAGPAASRLGGPLLPAAELHIPERSFHSTPGHLVDSLTSSLPHEVHPNPLAKQIGATLFTGPPVPVPIPAPRVVVGAEAVNLEPREPEQDGFVVGHTAEENTGPRAPAVRSGIVIGLSHNDETVSRAAAPVQRAPRPRALPSNRRNTVVIGSTKRRRRRSLL